MKKKKKKRRRPKRGKFFSGFQRSFLEILFALATPHGLRSNSKINKKKIFITILGLKDCDDFKGRQEMSQYQVVPFEISANFGFNLSAKVYAGENPYKNGEFLVGF